MHYFFICLVTAATLVFGQECDKQGILLYEDLGCTAEYDTEKKCPLEYSCQGLEPHNKNCYFRGKSYESNEQVPSSLSSPSCNAGCFCSTRGDRPAFTCAILDCPEWLGIPITPGCYRNYTLGSCCSVGEICPPFDNIETCRVEGKDYKEGQRFNPSNTCLECVCQKGFSGKFEEPFCERRSCGLQLRSSHQIQDFCAPFYSRQLQNDVLCCPDDWICPKNSETIKGDIKSEKKCKFGNETLKVGQYIEHQDVTDGFGRSFKNVKCECVVPPFLKCRDI